MSDVPDLQEEVDLDPERRRYVRDTYARLESMTHYELLGVEPSADKKAIKQAYFRLVTLVHTDRYFGKRLGSYRAQMEAIFARLTYASETLVNPAARAEYNESIGAPISAPVSSNASPMPPPSSPISTRGPSKPGPTEAELAEQRRLKLEAQKKRLDEARMKAREQAAIGARAHAAGDLERALSAYRLALTLLPEDAGLRAAHSEVSKAVAEKRIESFVRQAVLEERYGHWAEAAASWERVLVARPGDAEATDRLAKARARAKAVK
jgi:curved DNA-binding protein CbpA